MPDDNHAKVQRVQGLTYNYPAKSEKCTRRTWLGIRKSFSRHGCVTREIDRKDDDLRSGRLLFSFFRQSLRRRAKSLRYQILTNAI